MLIALSFVPPEDVGSAFDELNDSRPDNLQNVYDYWEDNYVGLLRRNRRANPLFPITMWNMRGSVANGLPRTNNSVEGWYNAFHSSVACHHPTIYTLVHHFRREQDLTEQTISRIQSGIIPTVRQQATLNTCNYQDVLLQFFLHMQGVILRTICVPYLIILTSKLFQII
jgi:hypothetical protein